MNFRIEPMTADHLDQCAAVFIAAFTKPDCFAWDATDVRNRLIDMWNLPKRIGLIALDSSENLESANGPGGVEPVMSGFALGDLVQVVDGLALRVGELCVHPSRQGFGLGSRLLLGMEVLARKHGASSAYLSVQPDSVDFCERLGYERQDEWVAMGRRLGRES